MKAGGHREVEIKLRVDDAAALRKRLRQLRAKRLRRVHERNTLFDTEDQRLARQGRLLRLRRMNGTTLLTYKGPAEATAVGQGRQYKVREELEIPVPNAEVAEAVVQGLGFRSWFRYEKYRTSYRLPGLKALQLECDETPIGVFLELEGPPRAIDRAARLLGYGPRDYITANYFVLYREHCRERGILPTAMLFPRKHKRGKLSRGG